MLKGSFAEACAKLERSEALDPGIGTQFNLARCYDLSGRLASAYAAYERVVAETHAAGQTSREAIARDLAAALEPRLAHLTLLIRLDGMVPGLELSLDGTLVPRRPETGRGATLAVDPGTHVVTASAPGSQTWRSDVSITRDAQSVIVVVPPLVSLFALAPATDMTAAAASPGAGREAPLHEAPSGHARAQKIAAIALGALGVAGIGVGSYFGVESWSHASQATSECGQSGCDQAGFSLRSQARSDGDVSTVAFAIGAALVVAGVVVWLTAPSDASHPAARSHFASFQTAANGGAPAVSFP